MKQKDISKRICSFYMIIFMLMIPIYGIWAAVTIEYKRESGGWKQ